MTVAEILSSNCQTSHFVAGLKKAGLFNMLNGPGPFTVFAPTNCACGKINTCTRNGWAADPDSFSNALRYHIAYGALYPQDLAKLKTLGMLQGSPADVWARKDGKKVIVNRIKSTHPYSVATNGVVYYLDTMLTPPASTASCPSYDGCPNNIITVLSADPEFSMIVGLIETAGLTSEIAQSRPITFFAPTNTALSALSGDTLDQLSSNPSRLRELILYHMVPGAYSVRDLQGMSMLDTFLGIPVRTVCVGNTVKVDGQTVVVPDISTGNGMIQGIDGVMIPSR